jgi:hypothetical protein
LICCRSSSELGSRPQDRFAAEPGGLDAGQRALLPGPQVRDDILDRPGRGQQRCGELFFAQAAEQVVPALEFLAQGRENLLFVVHFCPFRFPHLYDGMFSCFEWSDLITDGADMRMIRIFYSIKNIRDIRSSAISVLKSRLPSYHSPA